MEILLVVALLLISHQQYCIHLLVNKLMSRNYHEYFTTQNSKVKENKAKLMDEVPEDLRPLQEFGYRV